MKIEGGGIIDYGKNEAAGKYAEVNGSRIYYEVYGQGQPLIVLHDFFYNMVAQAAYYPELMKKYQVILVDMRGQNITIPLNQTDILTHAVMASDVNQLMEQLKIDSANIWGVSVGAEVGLLMAKDYPKRVKKLLAYALCIQNDTTALSPLYFKRLEDADKQVKDPQAKRILNFLMNEKGNGDYMLFSELSKIKASVLVVSGDKGQIRKEHGLKISKSLPNGQFCCLPGGGNNIVYKMNKAFLSIMEEFFADRL